MAYDISIPNRVKKYLKKIKDKRFKALIVKTIFEDIANHPDHGRAKTGDLTGIYVWNLTYQKTAYRIAYTFEDQKLIVIVLAGSHENFYNKLKQLT